MIDAVAPTSVRTSQNGQSSFLPRLPRWWSMTAGSLLASTCIDGPEPCAAPSGGDSDAYLQDLQARAPIAVPDNISGASGRDENRPCLNGDGSLLGAEILLPSAQRDIFIRNRTSGQNLDLLGLNDPARSDVACKLDAAGDYVGVEDQMTGAFRLYERSTGLTLSLPAGITEPVALSALFPPEVAPPPPPPPPETTITSGPSGQTTSTPVTFAFASSQMGSTFACRFDSAPFALCTSPVTRAFADDGVPHSFEVRAIGPTGIADATPASQSFAVFPAGRNFFAAGLEITQAIQERVIARSLVRFNPALAPFFAERTYNASPPLVKGKPGVLRLYAGLSGVSGSVDRVPALLHGFRIGRFGRSVPLPGSPLRPFHQTMRVFGGQSVEDVRGVTVPGGQRSWNFRLPAQWASGTIHLVAEANAGTTPIAECPGCVDEANRMRVSASFNETGVTLIRPWKIRWTGTTPPREIGGDPDPQFRDLRKLYPTAPEDAVVLPYHGIIETKATKCSKLLSAVTYARYLWLQQFDLEIGDFDFSVPDEVLSQLFPELYPASLPGPLKKTAFYGVGPTEIPGLTGCGSGSAYVGTPIDVDAPLGDVGQAVADALGLGGPSTPTPTGWGLGDRPLTHAHEIGHIYGLIHASNDHGECGGGSCEADWPYEHGGIGTVGFDIDDMQPRPAANLGAHASHDFMSYGPDRWVSLLSYRRLYSKLRLSGSQPATASSLTRARAATAPRRVRPVLRTVVSGVIDSDGVASIEEVAELPITREDTLARSGSHALVVRDRAGRALVTRNFEPLAVPDEIRGVNRFFVVSLPRLGAGAARLELRRGAAVLASRVRSPNAPTLRVRAPSLPRGARAAASPGASVTIRWSAGDKDGGALRFAVEYSRDGGRRWRPLATGVDRTSYRTPLALLGGSRRARLRVIASDGFNTRIARSSLFTVPNAAPMPAITLPRTGSLSPAGTDPVFSGSATDVEDAAIPARRLRWSSSRDGAFGTSGAPSLVAASIGRHTITLTATDSNGRSASRSISIRVTRSGDASDRIAPRVVRIEPRVGARSVPRTSTVQVGFSEDVVGVNSRTLRLIGDRGPVSATVTYLRETRTAVLRPRRGLLTGSTYRAELSPGVTDLRGHRARGRSWRFTVKR